MTDDPLALAARLAQVFRDLGVRYLLGGSFASTTFGEPRATLDIDFVADLRPEQVGIDDLLARASTAAGLPTP